MAYYEFKKHVDGIPNFVTLGAFFYNPDDNTYVTYIPDSTTYWIPDTLLILTKAQVEQRAKDINTLHPFHMIDIENSHTLRDMTEDEVSSWVLRFFNDIESN